MPLGNRDAIAARRGSPNSQGVGPSGPGRPHNCHGSNAVEYGQTTVQAPPVLDLTDFKRDLSELTDRLGNAQDCL